MRTIGVTILLLISWVCFAEPTFRLHINSEPATLSPFVQKSSSGSFIFTQLHSPLLWIENGKLNNNLGHCIQENSKQISCAIFKWAKFSNGEPIMAQHFVDTFREFLNPKNPAFRADLLLEVANAQNAIDGKIPLEKIGLHAKGRTLTIDLEKPNYEFIYNLANPILSPVFDNQKKNGPFDETWVVSGPFKLKKWEPKEKITLVPNPYYPGSRPNVEFQFIGEDTVAMNLYEKDELDFLRRLPTLYISKYKSRSDFHAIDQFRFDYVGLSSKLPKELRLLLRSSPNYTELQKLLLAKPRPGCVGIPASLLQNSICTEKNILSAKEAKNSDLQLMYVHAKQGGDDQSRIAQWFQSEWEKNANIKVGVTEIENKVFVDELKKRTPLIFHKGLAPDRPTCAAVLESFLTASPENYIDYKNNHFEKLVKELIHESSPTQKKIICTKAFTELLKDNNIIPLGPLYFSVLVKNEWKNWTLNELNELNLSRLKWKKKRP